MAIPKIYKYGIEITKPWSSEMYDFNDNLREYYTDQIKNYIKGLTELEDFHSLASIVNPYGYGVGLAHDKEYMREDMINNINNEGNWWIKDVVQDLLSLGHIEPLFCEPTPEKPKIHPYEVGLPMNFIGFESREEILMLRERYS